MGSNSPRVAGATSPQAIERKRLEACSHNLQPPIPRKCTGRGARGPWSPQAPYYDVVSFDTLYAPRHLQEAGYSGRFHRSTVVERVGGRAKSQIQISLNGKEAAFHQFLRGTFRASREKNDFEIEQKKRTR